MCDVKVQLPGKVARGLVFPLGPANLVAVVTDNGMVGCGAFDVAALEKFQYPAARVRPSKGDSIATIDDLLDGIVKDANGPALARGVKVGMTGREALGKL
ncbi:MAG: YunC family protein [Methanomicrobiales archaeon]|nr:YunC family protein [Methanomicrobiales archaeon]